MPNLSTRRTPTGLLAVVLLAVVATTVVYAQIDLQPKLVLRPVTSGDISAYKLPATTEMSGGLTTVGVGQAAYLEADVNIAEPASDINGVTWTLTSKPSGSQASIGDSPLGASVPVFEPSDRLVSQVAGRALLRPDVTGVYVVTGVITTHSGPTATVAQTIVAANYVGITACSRCHSGGLAKDMTQSWSNTLHAGIFKSEITGAAGDTSYASSCWGCHTVGYDLNSTIPNGGFDKVMKQLGWIPPTNAVPENWTNMPAALQNVANIQCENCHGPGSEHANSGGTPWEISKTTTSSGACIQCHDAPTHHVKGTEWYSSMHAVTTRDPAGSATCVGCHTGTGFIGRMTGATNVDTAYAAINCQTCHEPHGQTTPTAASHIIRAMGPVTLADGTTTVSNAGEGALCMNCHQSRQNAQVYAATAAASAHFGPHDGPQADMLEGANGFTYGRIIPSSAHSFVAKDTCVACHMQATATTDAAFLQAGGHTFKPSFTNAAGTKVELVAACQGCHGPEVTTFNFPLMDYNDDGKIEGVQTEVQHLLDQLSSMLPPYGQPQTALNIDSTWTRPQLEAAYNWQFVNNDRSKGIHNTAYAVGLLKASIDDLNAKK